MFFIISFILFIIIILLFVLWNYISDWKWKSSLYNLGGKYDIPALPNDYPILGHLTTFKKYPTDNHMGEHKKNFKKLNCETLIVRAPGLPTRTYVLTISPDVVKHITSTKFEKIYEKGDKPYEQYLQFLGNGIFNVNGDKWRRHKSVVQHIFHVNNLKNYIPIFSNNAKRIFDKLEQVSTESLYKQNGVDLQDYFMRYTLDSFAEIAFGVKLKSIEEDVNNFAIAFDKVQTQSERRGRLGEFWKIFERIKPDHDYIQKLQYINDTVNSIIQHIKSLPDNVLKTNSDALSSIILQVRENKTSYTDEELRDFVMNFLIAGRDTTAMLLTWTFYYLALHPEVENKIIDEINKVIGDNELTFENIKNLHYLKCVLQETLRLKPPVPIDGYTAKANDVLPGGYRVKKGWEIYYLSDIMHKRDEYFENPNDFIPERFLKNNGCKEGMNHPSIYIPFHFGPRTCLGREMAYEEAKIMVCNTLRNGYRFRLHKGFKPDIKISIILTSKNGMWMDMHKVNN